MFDDNLKIEFVIYKKDDNIKFINKYKDMLFIYLAGVFADKVIFVVPIKWDGFYDGTFNMMFEDFGQSLYVALAYFTDGSDIVTDFDGKPIPPIEVSIEGVQMIKYVKKRMRIYNLIDADKNIFKAGAFAFNHKLIPPISKVFEAYSSSVDSNITLQDLRSIERCIK